MLGNINARNSANKDKVDKVTSLRVGLGLEEVQPSSSQDTAGRRPPTAATQDDQDNLHGIVEQVHARITEHLKGVPDTYLPTTDDESDANNEAPALPKKKPKGTWGK